MSEHWLPHWLSCTYRVYLPAKRRQSPRDCVVAKSAPPRWVEQLLCWMKPCIRRNRLFWIRYSHQLDGSDLPLDERKIRLAGTRRPVRLRYRHPGGFWVWYTKNTQGSRDDGRINPKACVIYRIFRWLGEKETIFSFKPCLKLNGKLSSSMKLAGARLACSLRANRWEVSV